MQLIHEPLSLKQVPSELSTNLELSKSNSQTQIRQSSHVLMPNRQHFSPQYKKPTSATHNNRLQQFNSPERTKKTTLDNILFTIEQNYYFRKNENNVSPRPPKFRALPQRTSSFPQPDLSQSSRQKKVVFTNHPPTDRPSLSKKESSSSKSIIRNNSLNNKQNEDNRSVSSRSISVQNSFVSQLRTSTIKQREKPRVDNNRQKYSQIMSFFESSQNKKKGRYEKGTKIAKKQNEKYTDNIFPPVYSSLYLLPKPKNSTSQMIWKRLSDFSSHLSPMVLPKPGESSIIIQLDEYQHGARYIAIALNAVKNCKCILQRIFEDQVYNNYGLYLLKIFQQSNWKSIILDDHIPFKIKVIQNTHKEVPSFIDVKQKVQGFEIWPFLLLKAFANYYSTYEMMTVGNVIDFLNELTGLTPVQITIKKKTQKQISKLKIHLLIKDSFAIGELSSQHNKYIIIRNTSNQENDVLVYSQYPTFRDIEFTKLTFEGIRKLFIYNPRTYNTLATATIGKYNLHNKNPQRAEYSLRKLIVLEQSPVTISIQQKQSRFFCKSSLKYYYIWLRIILVQREYNGYRWIEGKYSNTKSTSVSATLTPGEYYLIVMPEWKKSNNFQLTLLVWANHLITIEREKSNSCEQMIEQACMDLSQRKGTISQLKQHLCSYNYICPQTGFIIQNVNNQKLKEEITINRKITGIPCCVELVPLNRQFWQNKQSFKQEIDIVIPKLSAYTIVLKMRGGIDSKLVKLFSKQKEK